MTQGDLTEVNSRLAEFDVTMYRGEDDRYRIWGDINRIQQLGAEVLYDPDDKIGLEIVANGPSDADMEAAFTATYDWYRLPPSERLAL